MSAGGTTEWVDRAPKQSKEMREAYKQLAATEAWVAACHAREDWVEHHEAVDILMSWYAYIGQLAQAAR